MVFPFFRGKTIYYLAVLTPAFINRFFKVHHTRCFYH